MTAKTEAN